MESLFPGLSAMENLHPVFVHFPLVLLPLSFLFLLLGRLKKREDFQRAAVWLLYLGPLGAGAGAGGAGGVADPKRDSGARRRPRRPACLPVRGVGAKSGARPGGRRGR